MNNINDLKFKVSEIFYSIQGESTLTGLPCVFIRLQGCHIRCQWCDTPYALEIKNAGKEMTVGEIMPEIEKYNCKYLLLTGGEPLLQTNSLPFMEYLCDIGYTVALETSGSKSIEGIDPRVIKILDMKCPDSNAWKHNDYTNLDIITKNDEVKFVIGSRKDYDWAIRVIDEFDLNRRTAAILFSPVSGQLDLKNLAEWILEDRLNVRFQIQLHKLIWGADAVGV
ncbi:MAG: hypothetical protein HW421_577 [Ignavibacteria bacterium]|nr:hypothetical protein [Ignavibacteria bacterium]